MSDPLFRCPLPRSGYIFAVVACVLIASAGAQGQKTPAAADQAQPLAVVGGQPVYEQDIAPLIEGPINQLRSQEYQVKKEALDRLITDKLVSAEAKKRNTTAEELLK